MTITELRDCEMNRAIAYTLGMIYPLYKERPLFGRTYITGCVNHNKGKVTQNELNAHYRAVFQLFNECMGDSAPELKTNKTAE